MSGGQAVAEREGTAADSTPQAPEALEAALRTVMERQGAAGWELRAEEFWTRLLPPDHRPRTQGWKLHVSATPASAPQVLAAAAGRLLALGCAFKYAGTLERAEALVSGRYDRAGAGKFLTAYPDDDAHALRVAEALDRATDGLAGQRILSDRPYRPGSLVHYRYGAFRGRRVLGNDGSYEIRLIGPDGSTVRDERRPAYTPPAWVSCPFPEPPAARVTPPGRREPERVLLAGRFEVRGAIRHANKGGVYRAVDRDSGAPVILKQARRHTAAHPNGEDARDALRHEAAALDRLLGVTGVPRKLALFEHGGDVFLAQSTVPGIALRRWTEQQLTGPAGLTGLPIPQVLAVAREITDLVAAAHARGLVLRDLTPNNLMIDTDGRIGLVDLELATRPGTPVHRAGTPGYAAPEQMAAERRSAAPESTADLYSLGAVLYHLATGADPVFAEDEPPARTLTQRLADLLATAGVRNPAARRLEPLILALLHHDPSRRPQLDAVRADLDDHRRPVPRPRRKDAGLSAERRERLLRDGVEHLLATLRPEGRRLWPTANFGSTTDPCAVQHGAAGPIALLTRLADCHPAARDGLRTAADWLERTLPAEPTLLPGLYFGRSGTAWALHDAARALDDPAMADRALDLAALIPLRSPNPDVCHGTAGAGLAQLHLWQATGDRTFLARAETCADHLAGAVQEDRDGRLRWQIPADFDSALAGLAHHGFAHGTAGIGAFLLATARATRRSDLRGLAVRAGDTLLAAADHDGDAAWWGSGETVGGDTRMPNWCSGSSGVGTFLIRLWAATGETRFRTAAEAAGAAVLRSRWQTSPAACHGLAGNGQFLLDLAQLLHDPRYLHHAAELAGCLDARHAVRDGRRLIPDESVVDVVADYQTGTAGALDFLHRLQHGGPRPWMPEPGTASATAAAPRPC
ncbi:class IV lanthionine synthetase LanL [Streptomyces sp. TLI_171]|uniref:class IV lanthionine synthetase LanL n=1 Tax=Streptomyces sp. TLI_171 TaxID=1938859 RepID=UPI000C180B84|nr:class IV lanthionine synthetase LanL [Streptomyces sp. TLI_171]RKE17449.1 serine/threonine protein kinase [Streptomyces sp. TLI_171]